MASFPVPAFLMPANNCTTVDYDSGMTVADSTTVMHDSQQDSCTTVNTTVIWQLVWQLHDSYTTVIRQLYDRYTTAIRQLYDSCMTAIWQYSTYATVPPVPPYLTVRQSSPQPDSEYTHPERYSGVVSRQWLFSKVREIRWSYKIVS